LTSSFDVSGLHTHLKCLDAIFNEENKKSSLSRYAALKVRRGRALETGDCAPRGARRRQEISRNRRDPSSKVLSQVLFCFPESVSP